MLQYCDNLEELKIPTTKVNCNQLRKVIKPMEMLQSLDIPWTSEIHPLLLICGQLKELTVRMEAESCVTGAISSFEKDLDTWINKWVINGFQPQMLKVVVGQCIPLKKLIELWYLLNPRLPTGHTGCLELYSSVKVPMNLFPVLPDFKLQFGQSCSLPLVKPNKCGLLGLEELDIIFIDSNHHSEVTRKAVMIKLEDYILRSHFTADITGLSFVTQFDASRVHDTSLYSGHLEQLAMACPNLEHLNLLGNHNCLDRLQGLYAICTYCKNLQGLNIVGIVVEITQVLQLWKTLVDMKLTYLAIELEAITLIRWINYKIFRTKDKIEDNNSLFQECICLFQQCVSLKALEIHATYGSAKETRNLSVLSYFPSLVHCVVGDVPDNIEVVINSCSKLKYFVHTCWTSEFSCCLPVLNRNLEQLCIKAASIDRTLAIPNTFMQSVSAHGRLVHVVLCAGIFSSGGIITLISNSPELLTCHIYGFYIIDFRRQDVKTILKKKFANRKLFTCGSFLLTKVKRDGSFLNIDNLLIERRADIFSLWSAEWDMLHRHVNYRLL